MDCYCPGMRTLFLLAVALVGCGGRQGAPGMVPSATCISPSGLQVELEAGGDNLCQWSAQMVDGYRARYVERWGEPGLSGWVIRVRTNDSDGHIGKTYAGTIDIQDGQWRGLPHEFHHVAMGMGHDGWCVAFGPWEESSLGFDERAYLGCP